MQSLAMVLFVICCSTAVTWIHIPLSKQSVIQLGLQYGQGARWSAGLLLLDATSFLDVLRVFKHCVDELAEQALHVALATWKQTLQEGYVAAVGRQQKSDVRQALDYGQGEGCEGRKHIVNSQDNPKPKH